MSAPRPTLPPPPLFVTVGFIVYGLFWAVLCWSLQA